MSRYARAFFKYTEEKGRSPEVARQVKLLLDDPDAAARSLEPEIERLTALLISHGRLEYAARIFRSYLGLYYASRGIKMATLTTAAPAPELVKTLSDTIGASVGCRVILDAKVDPQLIGGFVFEIDDRMVDASVKRQIETIRRQFIEKNRRIV